MGQFTEREKRVLTRLEARLNYNGQWSDATILNVSSYGLMAQCDKPPKRCGFIELRRGQHVIVGQVRWTSERHFGCRTQQQIHLEGLMNANRNLSGNGNERRANNRHSRKYRASGLVTAEERQARSRYIGRFFEFASIAAVIAIAAFFTVDAIGDFVSEPMERARVAMNSPGQ